MGKKVVKKKARRTKKNNKKNLIIIMAITLIVLIALIKINSKKENTEENLLIIENQEISQNLENEIIKKNNEIYMSFDDIKNYIDKTIFQEETGKIITTSNKKLAVLELDSNEMIVNNSKTTIKEPAFKDENGIIYLPISEMKKVYDIEITQAEESGTIIIDYYSKKLIKAYTNKNVKIKSEKSKFSKTIEKITKGNWLVYISEENGWAKVRTQSGKIGYIKSKYLTNFITEREDFEDDEEEQDIGEYLEYDITDKDLSTYSKREKIINDILNEAIDEDYKAVKLKYDESQDTERLKIEISPILKECGISIYY